MSLAPIVAVLGGDLWDGGRRANVPGPGHGPEDRSVSLLLAGSRVVVHGFAGEGWREILDHLRALGLVDAAARLAGGGSAGAVSPPLRTQAERVARAIALWR